MKNKRALFLDRDGVINVDTGYPHHIDEIVFVPGAMRFIRDVTEAGWPIFITTNQAGIAYGYYSEDDFCVLMSWYIGKIEQAGGKLKNYIIAHIMKTPFLKNIGKGVIIASQNPVCFYQLLEKMILIYHFHSLLAIRKQMNRPLKMQA